MKQLRFIVLLLSAAMTIFIISCNNDSTTAESTTDTSTKETPTPPPPPVNTIVTTPQGMVVATHKVADFDKWLASYEAHDSIRLANGLHNYVIGRSAEDPSTVMVALKVDDMAKAKAFANSQGLKDAMKKGGVIGKPTMEFTTSVYQDTATIAAKLRSRTTFTVKDFDAWVTSFSSHNQERLDNGIVTRMYGHDPDDKKKVILVTAITDSTKAAAFWKSDLLKQRRAESGVTSEPKRFLFNIVKRY